MTLQFETFIQWYVDNMPKRAIADLCEQVDIAGDEAVRMVKANALVGPYLPELIFDELAYCLPDLIGVYTDRTTKEDDDFWQAYRNELDGSPVVRGETQLSAIVALLRRELEIESKE